MINNLKNIISQNIINIPGFRTDRKIVVFESDDWGSIRMPSKQVYNDLKNFGIPVDKSPYCKFDALESNSDLIPLFELLSSFKDYKGNHPVITANTVVANPDFEKIKNHHFKEYFYQPFTETLAQYPNHDQVFDLYKDGISKKLFFPQFHGREHVNVDYWLELLQTDKDFQFAFERNLWGLSNDVFPGKKSIQATFDSNQEAFLSKSVLEGLELFKQLFGYKSESFIANNFIWSKALESVLSDNGVKYLQGMKYQKLPRHGDKPCNLVRHHLGEKNKHDQLYGVRNCSFEPAIDGEGYLKTIAEIQNAFFWKKPAVVSTHRINFIGSLNEANQKQNLQNFTILIKTILNKWPDVEFLTTMELDKIIRTKNVRSFCTLSLL